MRLKRVLEESRSEMRRKGGEGVIRIFLFIKEFLPGRTEQEKIANTREG